jgi:tetratricopeptide (TPR) repeat protein
VQVNTGNYKLGMELFDKLLEANPKLIAAYLGRGTAQALQVRASASAGASEKPAGPCRRVHAASSGRVGSPPATSCAAAHGRGARQGNLTAAGKDFSTCIEIDPKCSDAWKRRGQTRAALGFDAEAVKDLTKARLLPPRGCETPRLHREHAPASCIKRPRAPARGADRSVRLTPKWMKVDESG